MRASMTTLVVLGLALVPLATATPALSQGSPADCLIGPVRLTVDPPEPRFAGARPTVSVTGTWCQGSRPQLTSFGTNGRLLQLRARASSSGVSAVVPFSISIQTPPLEVGNYRVELLIDDEALPGGLEAVFRGGFRVLDLHECTEAGCPGASLLFPYFEVDPENPLGRTTMMSIANADDEPALTRVVLWSNWGLPLLGFDVVLPSQGLRSLHLGALLTSGALPSSAQLPDDLPGCPSPAPVLDGDALAALRARLLGEPDPSDGLCYAGATPAGLISGYVSVDVVQQCSDTAQYPGDPGYFEDVNGGVASDRNVLSGDWFLIDQESGQSRAFRASPLRADGALAGTPSFRPGTFYGPPGFDHRAPLPIQYESRVLAGAPFATDLILWTRGAQASPYAGFDCSVGPAPTWVGFARTSESPLPDSFDWQEMTTQLRTQRIDVTTLPGDSSIGFGKLRLCTKSRSAYGLLSPPTRLFQAWVGAVFSFAGAHGVSVASTPISDVSCF